ncbi:N-6 DNA methylase [Paenibacillus sp. BC26]|uniref:restriction endonuclease subunit M n=1 Tax=Paenibacillus sp. BC26 TaxID=1881032 RepID=UPI0008EA163B|nr:N-6 DNA methylase [Paenibacillus sp. BC26]SFT19219.1 type I restriction enzyme M protein [Paenibacillus sp. BC26]
MPDIIAEAEVEIKEGYILDYISGKLVKDSPEEREAVQVFSEILVRDYGYPKEHIQTRPQWRVKVRPSDKKKEYPIDIAVFEDATKTEDNISIIIECKKKNRKDGRSQLEDYLRFSKARMGVWFNGEERFYLVKTEKGGKVLFEEIPNIPQYGQRLEDVGQFTRKDLKPATNLKVIFRTIRNYLAANAVGATRDEIFAQQLINLIFCKIYDERFTKSGDIVTFRAGIDEEDTKVKERIVKLFEKVKKQYSDVIEVADSITLDANSLTYVVGELQNYCLVDSERDAVAEAFEIFIGPSLKGPQGQFFTPRNVVKMIVDMIDPSPDDKIIDPACGSGGFLVEALRYVWNKVEAQGSDLGWPDQEIHSEKQKVAIRNFRGIDKDSFLSKVAKAYMAILGDGRGGVFCENSLDARENWSSATQSEIVYGGFDIVLTNPPFGKKLAIDSEDTLSKYELGHVWKMNDDGKFEKGAMQEKQPPQILFIERCLDLLKPGGKMGIVLLESTFGMPKYRYVVDYLTQRAKINAIVAMPEDLFQPHTHAKTCVVICEKVAEKPKEPYPIFMSEVEWCGHDSRGNPTYRVNAEGKRVLLDDTVNVAAIYHDGRRKK